MARDIARGRMAPLPLPVCGFGFGGSRLNPEAEVFVPECEKGTEKGAAVGWLGGWWVHVRRDPVDK